MNESANDTNYHLLYLCYCCSTKYLYYNKYSIKKTLVHPELLFTRDAYFYHLKNIHHDQTNLPVPQSQISKSIFRL